MASSTAQYKTFEYSELNCLKEQLIASQMGKRDNANRRDLSSDEMTLLIEFTHIFTNQHYLNLQINKIARQAEDRSNLDLINVHHTLQTEIFDFLEDLLVKKIITNKSIYEFITHPDLNLSQIILNLVNTSSKCENSIQETIDLHLRNDAFLNYTQLLAFLIFGADSYEEIEKIINLMLRQEGDEKPQSILKYFFESPLNLGESFVRFLEALAIYDAYPIIENILTTSLLDSGKPIYIRLAEYRDAELAPSISALLIKCAEKNEKFQLTTLPQLDYLHSQALVTTNADFFFSVLKLNVFDDDKLKLVKDKKELIRDYIKKIPDEDIQLEEINYAIDPDTNIGKLLRIRRGFGGLFQDECKIHKGIIGELVKLRNDIINRKSERLQLAHN